MLFFASWRITPDVRERVLERFVNTRGAHREGVRIVGRWHRTDGTGGFLVCEAESMQPMAEFSYEWADLLFIEITPVVDDDELMALVAKLKQPDSGGG